MSFKGHHLQVVEGGRSIPRKPPTRLLIPEVRYRLAQRWIRGDKERPLSREFGIPREEVELNVREHIRQILWTPPGGARRAA